MSTYADITERLGKRESKKLANNTYLHRVEGGLAVRLHQTDILVFYPDGRVKLDSGGWKTSTTKNRMNAYGPCRICQEKGVWFVYASGFKHAVFADGLVWNPNTKSFEGEQGTPPEDTKKLVAEVKRFVKKYMAALRANEIPAPSAGDCWSCALNIHGGSEHIHLHMEEDYFVPTLLAKAIERFPVSMLAKSVLSNHWATRTSTGEVHTFDPAYVDGGLFDFAYTQLEKSLYRYIKEALGLAR